MKKSKVLLVVIVGLLASIILASCATPAVESSIPPLTNTVEVSSVGFNGVSGNFHLEVEKGQEVEITFVYGDGDFPQNNTHIIAIPDYGIETSVLDEDNPEVTVSFTASKIGKVSFKCTQITCVGHPNLQGGIIEIQ